MKIFTAFICCLSLFGCKTSIIGNYQYVKPFVYHKLEILSDSTFSYRTQGDLSWSITKGKWNMGGDTIKLNSSDAFLPYQVIESFHPEKEMITVSITDQDGVVLEGDFVTINKDKEKKYFVDNDGIILIPNEIEIQSFDIHSLKGEYRYKTKITQTNFFEVTYDSRVAGFLHFNPKKLIKMKRHKLMDIESNFIFKKTKK
jgi:hypothetical protein